MRRRLADRAHLVVRAAGAAAGAADARRRPRGRPTESKALAKALKARGFRFVGPTTLRGDAGVRPGQRPPGRRARARVTRSSTHDFRSSATPSAWPAQDARLRGRDRLPDAHPPVARGRRRRGRRRGPTWPEAERLAAELQPDAVVADLWMPTLDVDALQRLRDRRARRGDRLAQRPAAPRRPSGSSATTGAIDLFLSKRQPPAEIVEALRAFVRERISESAS